MNNRNIQTESSLSIELQNEEFGVYCRKTSDLLDAGVL